MKVRSRRAQVQPAGWKPRLQGNQDDCRHLAAIFLRPLSSFVAKLKNNPAPQAAAPFFIPRLVFVLPLGYT